MHANEGSAKNLLGNCEQLCKGWKMATSELSPFEPNWPGLIERIIEWTASDYQN